jgi:hypothetical protein
MSNKWMSFVIDWRWARENHSVHRVNNIPITTFKPMPDLAFAISGESLADTQFDLMILRESV